MAICRKFFMVNLVQKYLESPIPISDIAKKILTFNPNKIKFSDILSWGDDYELIFTSFKKNRKKLLTLAKKNKVKISLSRVNYKQKWNL